MFNLLNLFKKPAASNNFQNVANAVNKALDVPGPSGNGVDGLNGQSNKANGQDTQIINPELSNGIINSKLNVDECKHWFMKYPPLIGKIKTIINLNTHTYFN